MIIKEKEYLEHYGTLRRSGRYPYGSGGNPYQGNRKFLDRVALLKKAGMSESEIAKGMGMSTTQLRAYKSIAKNENRQSDISQAQRYKERGWSNVAIGERMGINESSVRSLLAPGAADKAAVLDTTSKLLRDQVTEKGFIDIGTGVEKHLAITEDKLKIAVAKLEKEGYEVHRVKVQQQGTGKFTDVKVLGPPGSEQKTVWQDPTLIKPIQAYSDDGGNSYKMIGPPTSISSKRVVVKYAEDGGKDADGVIYVRPGVDDISLGSSRYAQVRIAVDGSHYLKGMAMYKDDLPDGVDLMFNTNKSKASVDNDLGAMKVLNKLDPDNPFGSTIDRQSGVMNVLSEEGTWGNWSKSLSSQMLSKQSPTLAKTQLDMTFEKKKMELDGIMQLTNPAVRRKLLETYADGVDSSAVRLKAAALPRQGSHVILPVNSMKPTEVYAPNYRNGERVVLIRYPHGGTFEIPELTVNNRQPDAKKLLGSGARDAIGINSKVAERLSGADFDGDTVLVIPNGNGKIKTAPALEGLRNFDPQREYPGYDGMTKMSAGNKQKQMGSVSNLITDMTIRGASGTELAQAVRHSMVVIDAEKHGLNYKLSAINNGIPQLKEKYQGGKRAGASTLISLAGSETRVPVRKQGYRIDPKSGRKLYTETGETFVDKKGATKVRTQSSKRLAETTDANTLSSGKRIESVYADHSNRLKDLANTARRAQVSTKSIPYSPSAKQAYSKEVSALNAKLDLAIGNRPRERQAQIVAASNTRAKRRANPDMTPDEVKRLRYQELTRARIRTGADKEQIVITKTEWDAIQAGAISNHKLTQVLNNTDLEAVKKLATPRTPVTMTSVKTRRAEAMSATGYTQAEIADALGVSVGVVTTALSEEG